MSVQDHGDIIFECDGCGEALDTGQVDFDSAWNFAKREGWRAKKIGLEWEHECPECQLESSGGNAASMSG
jgi:hypothetical protein